MSKLRRAASVRSAKSIAVKISCKIGGRKSKVSTRSLSKEALLKEASHLKRPRDKNKIVAELRHRGLATPVESVE